MTLSEPQLIAPLLDGFVMGDPISNHDGVKCCPAMQLASNNKYIVKIVSVPSSPAKLAALLLAGAFTDKESALDYYKDLADGIVEEANLLQRLSRFEGFVSYEDWQVEPMDPETGYDVYLLSPYRPTLEGLIKNNSMTHLGAVNLGLDLCAALSVARRFGYIYADLQPTNIYICNEREYRIGDLGFISLESLPYASLPDKYHSNYTPPEISDAYSALNTTMDTYAVGMILYQAFNDGRLPPIGIQMAPPKYADAELSEIILKACSIHPQDRWDDPMQMGQALINYLQRNSVNDVPIVPPAEEEPAVVEEETADETEPSTEDILAEVDEALESAPALPETAPAEDESASEAEVEVPVTEEPVEISTPVEEEPEAAVTELLAEDVEVTEELPEESADAPTEELIADDTADAPTGELTPDETEVAPAEELIAEEESEDDVDEMLAQADDIISHQFATPVIEVQPIEVSMPTPTSEEETGEPEETEEVDAVVEIDEEQSASIQVEVINAAPVRKKHSGLIATVITISILVTLLLGGLMFFEHYYLQTVNDILLSGTEDKLVVTLDTDIPDEKLTILCTDTYGNTIRRDVEEGVAVFRNLKPGTTYKLQVRIEGFHKLLGETAETYTTAPQTTIGNFVASTGPEDGSVILSFTVQGPDTNQWKVHYAAEGEQSQTVTFTGHMVTLTGLTVGKEYTFTLEPGVELYLGGTDTLTYVASKIVLAENLHILGIRRNALHVEWAVPENITVSEWTVRCYNDAGYDHTITTPETTAYFENIDAGSAYTIEVTADGMTVSARTYLSADSVTFYDILVEDQDRTSLKVQWSYEGTAPEGGWLLLYTVGNNTEQKVVKCDDTNGVIYPMIPGGTYYITIKPANGMTAFGGTTEYDAPEAPAFSGYWVKAEDILFDMCITPDVENWDRYDVPQENYTTSFKVGSSASFVMHLTREYTSSDDEILTLFVIRDREGKIISNAYETRTWTEMWYRGYGKLTLPFLPSEPGDYTVWVYFNGTAATNRSFEVLPADET